MDFKTFITLIGMLLVLHYDGTRETAYSDAEKSALWSELGDKSRWRNICSTLRSSEILVRAPRPQRTELPRSKRHQSASLDYSFPFAHYKNLTKESWDVEVRSEGER